MLIHKCDVCGKEIREWLTVTVCAHSADSFVDLRHLRPYARTLEVCQDCYVKNRPFGKEK